MLSFFVIFFFFSCELLMNPIHSSTLDLIILSSMSSITRYLAYEFILCFLFAIQQLVLEFRKNAEIENPLRMKRLLVKFLVTHRNR